MLLYKVSVIKDSTKLFHKLLHLHLKQNMRSLLLTNVCNLLVKFLVSDTVNHIRCPISCFYQFTSYSLSECDFYTTMNNTVDPTNNPSNTVITTIIDITFQDGRINKLFMTIDSLAVTFWWETININFVTGVNSEEHSNETSRKPSVRLLPKYRKRRQIENTCKVLNFVKGQFNITN